LDYIGTHSEFTL